jgi:hypothetical protein
MTPLRTGHVQPVAIRRGRGETQWPRSKLKGSRCPKVTFCNHPDVGMERTSLKHIGAPIVRPLPTAFNGRLVPSGQKSVGICSVRVDLRQRARQSGRAESLSKTRNLNGTFFAFCSGLRVNVDASTGPEERRTPAHTRWIISIRKLGTPGWIRYCFNCYFLPLGSSAGLM